MNSHYRQIQMPPMLDPASSAPQTTRSQHTGVSQGQTTTTATTTTQAHRTSTLPTLRLRGGPIHSRRVTWSEEVVDNEELGRKKSKVCCIFKRNREFGESSDESSSDSSDSSEDSDIGDDKRKGRDENDKRAYDMDHDHDHAHNHSHHHGHQKPGRRPSRRPPSPNAYEKMPKNVTKKNKEGTSGTMTQS